jgi:hypothetical protein
MTEPSIHPVLTPRLVSDRGCALLATCAGRFATGVAFLLASALSHPVSGQTVAGHGSPAAAAFTPSNVAAPFGWASASADFNADGRADLAVAEHVGSRSGFAYRIDVQLSNGDHQSFSFGSPHPALRVTAFDVDNDHDIDLVVTPMLGREVVGVWLNDGAGHFRFALERAGTVAASFFTTTRLSGCPPQLTLAIPYIRRASITPMPASVALLRRAPAPPACENGGSSQASLVRLAPRAPPSRI